MESQHTNAAALVSQAFDLLAAGDESGAVTTLTATLDAEAALEGLAQLCKRAYRDLKSVPAMTAVASAAVRFGLKCANASPDSECSRRYKARVRAIAFNAGANCWAGWGDPVEINSTDVAEGVKFAEQNYELVEELGLGGKERGGALWLVGALQMAAGQLSAAIAHFLQAEKAFHDAQLLAHEAMAQGYAALADKALAGSGSRRATSLVAILESLRAMESGQAHFFADQLVTADRIFSSR